MDAPSKIPPGVAPGAKSRYDDFGTCASGIPRIPCVFSLTGIQSQFTSTKHGRSISMAGFSSGIGPIFIVLSARSVMNVVS